MIFSSFLSSVSNWSVSYRKNLLSQWEKESSFSLDSFSLLMRIDRTPRCYSCKNIDWEGDDDDEYWLTIEKQREKNSVNCNIESKIIDDKNQWTNRQMIEQLRFRRYDNIEHTSCQWRWSMDCVFSSLSLFPSTMIMCQWNFHFPLLFTSISISNCIESGRWSRSSIFDHFLW